MWNGRGYGCLKHRNSMWRNAMRAKEWQAQAIEIAQATTMVRQPFDSIFHAIVKTCVTITGYVFALRAPILSKQTIVSAFINSIELRVAGNAVPNCENASSEFSDREEKTVNLTDTDQSNRCQEIISSAIRSVGYGFYNFCEINCEDDSKEITGGETGREGEWQNTGSHCWLQLAIFGANATFRHFAIDAIEGALRSRSRREARWSHRALFNRCTISILLNGGTMQLHRISPQYTAINSIPQSVLLF